MKTGCTMVTQSDVKRLEAEQAERSKLVIMEDATGSFTLVAGVDVAYKGGVAYGAAVVLDQSHMVVEEATSKGKAEFPYIPGLFSYREQPHALSALEKLKGFDAVMVEGHGVAHPRGFGLACQLGLNVGKPTVGVARGLLVGEPSEAEGEALIMYGGKPVAVRLISPTGSPIYVSVGHMVTLLTAVELVKKYMGSTRMPLPLACAHRLSREARRADAQQ